jgi:hypothetical protein
MDVRCRRACITLTTIGTILAMLPASAAETSPRLKYRAKHGVCACSSGMSEADISRAMAGLDRLEQSQDAGIQASDHRTEQPMRREDDAAGKQR